MAELEKLWVAIWSPRQAAVGVESMAHFIANNRKNIDEGRRTDWLVVGCSDNEDDARAIATEMQDRRDRGEFPAAIRE